MSESLWNDIDEWLVSKIQESLGSEPVSPVQTVRAIAEPHERDWDDPSLWTFPAVAVIGRSISRLPGGMSGTGLNFENRYLYLLSAISVGEQTAAMAEVKLLGARLERLVALLDVGEVLPADNGERLQTIDISDAQIQAYMRTLTQDETFYVLYVLAVVMETETSN